jgi:hypothetical protein
MENHATFSQAAYLAWSFGVSTTEQFQYLFQHLSEHFRHFILYRVFEIRRFGSFAMAIGILPVFETFGGLQENNAFDWIEQDTYGSTYGQIAEILQQYYL